MPDGEVNVEIAPEVIERAQRMGWTPREQFKGDPIKFVEADKFVERAEAELPILLERNRFLDRRLVNTEKVIDGLKGELVEVKGVLTEFRDFASKAEERAFNKAKKEIEDTMSEAVAKADVDGYNRAKKELDELNKSATPVPTPTPSPAPQVPQEIKDFVAENALWYDVDRELTIEAINLHKSVNDTHPNLSMADNLKRVKEKLIKLHPDKLEILDPSAANEAKRKTPSNALAGGNREILGGGDKNKAKTYDDLPDEAKKACDRFIKQIPNYKREDYIKTYFAGEQ